MAKRVIVDPITRIEGHLRIETEVENGKIVSAYSIGTMFRGLEIILKGRTALDAWLYAQRICGVCTGTHYQRSIEAVEDAFKNMIHVNLRGSTIAHDVQGKSNSSIVLLKPASEGTGVIAGGAVRPVLELAGLKDILTKSLRSNNPSNVVRATIKALEMLKN